MTYPEFYPPSHNTEDWAHNLYDSNRVLWKAFTESEWQQVIVEEQARLEVGQAMQEQRVNSMIALFDRGGDWETRQDYFYKFARELMGEDLNLTQGNKMNNLIETCGAFLEDCDIERHLVRGVKNMWTGLSMGRLYERQESLAIVDSSTFIHGDVDDWQGVIDRLFPVSELERNELHSVYKPLPHQMLNDSKEAFSSRHLFFDLLRSVQFYERLDEGALSDKQAMELISSIFLTAHDMDFFEDSSIQECFERFEYIWEIVELPNEDAEAALSDLDWCLAKARTE